MSAFAQLQAECDVYPGNDFPTSRDDFPSTPMAPPIGKGVCQIWQNMRENLAEDM